uniref:Dicer-2 n=1 Tax=Artemia franciscana TaxID=6661 RepID=A0A1S6YJH5_ARTSF|nr:Dicer-2 [Artemia franciscana]
MDQKMEETTHTPREYQIELAELCRSQNLIVALGTGAGKTFIAAMVARERANEVLGPLSEGYKRIIFLAPTRILVHQQREFMHNQTPFKVSGYTSEDNVDNWSKYKWDTEFEENHLLVMTHQVFFDILAHSFFNFNSVSLVIIDEVHSAWKDSPVSQVIRFRDQLDNPNSVRILGLTACVINDDASLKRFSEKVKKFETFVGAKVVTASDTSQVAQHSTNTQVEHVYFDDSGTCALMKSVKEMLINPFNNPIFKDAKKILDDASKVLDSLGIFALHGYLKSSLVIIDKFRRASETVDEINELNKLAQHFKELSGSLEKNLGGFTNLKLVIKLVTSKVAKLIELLKQHKNDDHNSFRCLIFVQERVICKSLCIVLMKIASLCPDLSFLRILYITGDDMSSRYIPKDTEIDKFKHKCIMSRFRSGECNTLISTSVLEEGIDVKACNIVVRFDLPLNFRSYIQSKGRARAKNGVCYLMLRNDQDVIAKLNLYIKCEKILKTCYSLNNQDGNYLRGVAGFIEEYAPFGKEGPRITCAAAISKIFGYCAKLPCDKFTNLLPIYEYKEHIDETNGVNSGNKKFTCTLTMPLNVPGRAKLPITSKVQCRKVDARRSVSLEMIKILHAEKELDDEHLLPVNNSKYLQEFDDRNDISVEGDLDAVIEPQKYQHVYEKKIPDIFLHSLPFQRWYLHVVQYEGLKLPPQCHRLGLLLPKPLPKLCRFPLFAREEAVMVFVEDGGECNKPDDVSLLMKFHHLIFKDPLYVGRRKESVHFDPLQSRERFFVVAVKPDLAEMATEFMQLTVRNEDWYTKQDLSVDRYTKHRINFKYERRNYEDSVITKWYDEQENRQFYYVKSISENTNPASLFPDCKKKTFEQHFKQQYGIHITDRKQNMLEAECVHSGLSLLKTSKQIKKQKTDLRTVMLIPELSFVHPLKASIWKQAVLLPSIFRRLNGLVNAEMLRRFITNRAGFDLKLVSAWPDLTVQEIEKEEILTKTRSSVGKTNESAKLMEELLLKLEFNNGDIKPSDRQAFIALKEKISPSKKPLTASLPAPTPDSFKLWHRNDPCGPSPGLLLWATTSLKANDAFSLERLELVGDSFLKYCASVHLFFKYPDMDEGRLTQCRSVRISNNFLYQIGKEMGIPSLIINEDFQPKKSWIPPLFAINSTATVDDSLQKTYEIETANKRIADVMEALIGCYLVTMGEKHTKQFIRSIGLKVTPFSYEEVSNLVCPPFNKNFEPKLLEQKIIEEKKFLHFIEEVIGYTFENIGFLAQAMTHPSYPQSHSIVVECYQRLEFLGDAVIDFLITCAIYNNPRKFGPGKLTDLRSALVNNTTFACVAVRNGFHKYFKRAAASLDFQIENFVKNQNDINHEVEFFRFLVNEEDTMELEQIDVPKCLGDIIESICGAVYLDSKLSLDAVWNVVNRLLHREIEEFSKEIPISPIRELYERFPQQGTLQFSEPEAREDGNLMINVTVKKGDEVSTYKGCGRTKKLAKLAAAKIAIKKDKEIELIGNAVDFMTSGEMA